MIDDDCLEDESEDCQNCSLWSTKTVLTTKAVLTA